MLVDMNKLRLYRIYCVTEQQHVSACAGEPLTACPNDVEHEIRAGSACQLPAPASENLLERIGDAAANDEQRERVLAMIDKFPSVSCCLDQGYVDEAKSKIQEAVDAEIITADDQALINGVLPS
jgi:hypothetical protein